jgi:tetratricopeptide (TPR) repeat protein
MHAPVFSKLGGASWNVAARLWLPALLFVAPVHAQYLPSPGQTQPPPPPPKPVAPAPATTGDLLKEQAELERILTEGDDAQRLTGLQDFLRERPNSPLLFNVKQTLASLHAQRGERELRAGKAAEARAAFELALEILPDAASPRTFRNFVLPIPVLMAALGMRNDSVLFLRKAQERAWNSVESLEQIGLFYLSVEDPSDAQAVFMRAIELDAKQSNLHYNLGVALQIGLRLDEAATEFQRATELDPKTRVAWAALGDIYRANGSFEAAEKAYREQLAVDSEHPTAWGGLAVTLLAQGRAADAIDPTAKMLAYNPRDARFFTQLAYLHAAQGAKDEASEALARARRLQPNYPWIRVVDAHLARLAGDYAEAENILGEALNSAKFATLRFELGKTLILANDYDRALEPFEEFLTLTPDGEFEATLGGALRVRTPRLARLIAPERAASLLVDNPLTSREEFRVIEGYLRFAFLVKRFGKPEAKPDSHEAPAAAAPDAGGTPEPGVSALAQAASDFVAGDDPARGLRCLYAAAALADINAELPLAEKLARRATDLVSEVSRNAVESRDGLTPEARLADFSVRAQTTLGWILFKRGEAAAAVVRLREAVTAYPNAEARKEASWKLGVVLESLEKYEDALVAYKDGYNKSSTTATVRRSVMETVYKKIHGSLDGFDDTLER